jgi:hypothetical protein
VEGCGVRRINYTDLDQMYRPGFVHVNGMGAVLDESQPQMLGGILASLFGKSQSWYDNVSRIQKELTVLQAEISAFGKDVWNAIANTPAAKQAGFTDYDYTMAWALNHMKAILVTQNYQPNDTVIASADAYAKSRRVMVEFAKKVAPEMAAQVAADRAKVEAQLVGARMISPAEAGEEAFVRSLEEQAGKLSSGFAIGGVGLAIAAVAVAALFFLGGGRRSNPVLPVSWNPGGLLSGNVFGLPKPLAYIGGAYLAWKFLKPKT